MRDQLSEAIAGLADTASKLDEAFDKSERELAKSIAGDAQ